MTNRISSILVAMFLAAVLALAFYGAAFTNFYYVRYKLVDAVRASDHDGGLRVTIPSDGEMEQCNIFVVKVNNRGNKTIVLRFSINQMEVARSSVQANSSSKLFLKISGFLLQKENQFEIRADSAAWTVEDWELRNVYKFSRGIITWIVADRDFKQYEMILQLPALLAFVLFFVGLQKYPPRGALRYFQFIVILLFISILCLPFVSNYKVLLSIKSFLLIVFLMLFPALAGTYRHIQSEAGTKAPAVRIAVVVGCVTLFFFLSARYALWEFKGNYSGFLLLSEKYLQKNPFLRKEEVLKNSLIIREQDGYDAQFYYNMVFDPWLTYYEEKPNKYRNIIDIPVFRYRRIAYPLLTKLLSLDRPEWYPQTMILLLLLSHALGAFFVAKIALHFRKSVWWTLLYVLVPGFTVSFRYGLPESIAAAFLAGGIYLYLKRRLALSLLLFSISLLTRETGALVVATLCGFELFKQKNWRAAILLALTFLPYFIWRGYVTWRLEPDTGWGAFFYEPGNFNLPFFGIAQLWHRVFTGQPTLDGTATSIFFPLLLIILFFFSIWMLRYRKDFLISSLALYSFLAISLNHDTVWVGVVNAERQSYECFLLLLLAFLSMKSDVGRIRFLPILIFLLLFIYNWCCLTAAPTFHAGLLFLN